MTHQLTMSEEGILTISFTGDIEAGDMSDYLKDLDPYLQAATSENPLVFLSVNTHSGRFSSSARKTLMSLNNDHRIGKTAVIGANRPVRVLMDFILKATGRNNIRIFDDESSANSWLKGN